MKQLRHAAFLLALVLFFLWMAIGRYDLALVVLIGNVPLLVVMFLMRGKK